MDINDMEFKIRLLSKVVGQIYEATHIPHTLESLAIQYSFSQKQYNAIIAAMVKLINTPCNRTALKQEFDTVFEETIPDLLFEQIIKGFIISSQQQNRMSSITYQNIMQILREEQEE